MEGVVHVAVAFDSGAKPIAFYVDEAIWLDELAPIVERLPGGLAILACTDLWRERWDFSRTVSALRAA